LLAARISAFSRRPPIIGLDVEPADPTFSVDEEAGAVQVKSAVLENPYPREMSRWIGAEANIAVVLVVAET
jgi:hypothetical protein